MNLTPYQNVRSVAPARKEKRQLQPYLILNSVIALLIFVVVLLPFVLPAIQISSVSTAPNGDPITAQTSITSIEWSGIAYALIPLMFFIANGSLWVIRTFGFHSK